MKLPALKITQIIITDELFTTNKTTVTIERFKNRLLMEIVILVQLINLQLSIVDIQLI